MGKKLFAVDTETSAWPWEGGHAIQIGVAIVEADTLVVLETYERIIALEEDAPWDLGAESIHHISRDRVRAEGVAREVVAAEVMALVARHQTSPKDRLSLFGQNVPFDVPLVEEIIGAKALKSFIYDAGTVDQMVWAGMVNTVWAQAGRPAPFWAKGNPSSSMDAQRATFGLTTEGAHTALQDILQELEAHRRTRAILAERIRRSFTGPDAGPSFGGATRTSAVEDFKAVASKVLDNPEVLRKLVEGFIKNA